MVAWLEPESRSPRPAPKCADTIARGQAEIAIDDGERIGIAGDAAEEA